MPMRSRVVFQLRHYRTIATCDLTIMIAYSDFLADYRPVP